MNRKAWQGSVFDKDVTIRVKKLGDLGEYLAEILLTKKGFTEIANLNKKKNNTKYFDMTAKRGDQSFAISVKARNRFENSVAGVKLNSRYKLTDDPALFEKEASEKYSSIASWIALSLDIDRGTFDAFFGRLQDLSGNRKGIIMTPEATAMYESLASQEQLDKMGLSTEELKSLINKYKLR